MKHRNVSIAFLLVLFVTLAINITWQEKIADAIFPEWLANDSDSDSKEVANPLAPKVAQLRQQGIDLVIPARTMLFETNPATTFSLLSMLPEDALTQKIDVLFIGDSTLMWGFDHRQVAHNSGLRTAQITFGQNSPDSDLAWFASILAQCVMADDGIIVVSYSQKGLVGQRANRSIDDEVRASVELENCADLANAMEPEIVIEANPLVDQARYKTVVLDKVIQATDAVMPFWSAHIGWTDFFPDKQNRKYVKYLVWQNGLKIPWQADFDYWRFRELDTEKASADWQSKRDAFSAEDKKTGRNYMQAWNGTQIGRPVCHVLPPTSVDEDFRFGLWREWTSSRCLLDFGSIAKNQLGVTELKVIDRHHYGEESGLVMAAAVGKLLKTQHAKISERAAIVETALQKDREPTDPAPTELAVGVWIR